MKSILLNNPEILVIAIIVIAVAVYVIKKGKDGLYSAALYFVTVAEEQFGSKTGKIKFAEVMTELKKNYPIITLFISEERLSALIEEALEEMKKVIQKKKDEELKSFREVVEKTAEPLKPLE